MSGGVWQGAHVWGGFVPGASVLDPFEKHSQWILLNMKFLYSPSNLL